MGFSIDIQTNEITITRGDTLRFQIELTIEGGVYIPTERDGVRFSMKSPHESNVILIHKDMPIDTMMVTICEIKHSICEYRLSNNKTDG